MSMNSATQRKDFYLQKAKIDEVNLQLENQNTNLRCKLLRFSKDQMCLPALQGLDQCTSSPDEKL